MIDDNKTMKLDELILPISREEKEDSSNLFSSLLPDKVDRLYKSYIGVRQDPDEGTQRLGGSLMVFQSRLNDPLTGDFVEVMYKLALPKRIDIFKANKQLRDDVQKKKSIMYPHVPVTDTRLSCVLSSKELDVSSFLMLSKVHEELKRIKSQETETLDKL
ncbi:hypothetical protein [Staphylococcus phage vB_SauH_DELF3]|nr:hypothetical protein [Staphylococcus phage vB_SauH_DELF3]